MARVLILLCILTIFPIAAQDKVNAMQCTGLTTENIIGIIENLYIQPEPKANPRQFLAGDPVFDNAMKKLLALEGTDIWLGYPGDGEVFDPVIHGMQIPYARTIQLAQYEIYSKIGTRWLIISYSFNTPDVFYLYPFTTLKKHGDANGNYYGIHPCGAFAVDYEDVVEVFSFYRWKFDVNSNS